MIYASKCEPKKGITLLLPSQIKSKCTAAPVYLFVATHIFNQLLGWLICQKLQAKEKSSSENKQEGFATCSSASLGRIFRTGDWLLGLRNRLSASSAQEVVNCDADVHPLGDSSITCGDLLVASLREPKRNQLVSAVWCYEYRKSGSMDRLLGGHGWKQPCRCRVVPAAGRHFTICVAAALGLVRRAVQSNLYSRRVGVLMLHAASISSGHGP
jgi:hypothetical protein